ARGVVAPRQQARAGRRAERGRVEVRVAQPVVGDPIDVRRLDQTPERLHRGEADIVENDVEDVRRPFRSHRLPIGLPVWYGVLDVDVDRALERLAHEVSLLVSSGDAAALFRAPLVVAPSSTVRPRSRSSLCDLPANLRPKRTWSLCTTTRLGSFGIGSSQP